MPRKRTGLPQDSAVAGRRGNPSESEWILELTYPLAEFPDLDDLADRLTCAPSEGLLQCWGVNLDGPGGEKTRRLWYGYKLQHLAMRDAKRCEESGKFSTVDVFDHKFPPGNDHADANQAG